MTINETKGYFDSRSQAIIDSIREIVEIESPSNYPDGNREVVDWIVGQIERLSPEIAFERILVDGVGEHLIVRAFPGDTKPVLVLGHTDTVHPIGAREQNPTRIEGDEYFGGGIFDMKANIVLMIEALRYFAETGERPSRPITILLACDEEVGSHSGREYVEREARPAEHCLVFEPSAAGRVKTGRKGTGMYVVRVQGIPAHAGLDPEKGASAILELSRQIERLHAMNEAAVGTTVNVCTASGGTTTNVIPEHAECTVDVRFSAMAEAERIDAAICSLAPIDDRVSLDISGGVNRPPMERTEAVSALFEKAREIAAAIGFELGETQVGGASDGNFVGALGVPVLDGLGITGDGAHTLNEYILVSDIANRAVLVTLLMGAE